MEDPVFLEWAERLRRAWDRTGTNVPIHMHRKLWEWIFIAEALRERGLLAPGKRGLGFGVGQEPLAAAFVAAGCDIVATDVDDLQAGRGGWDTTGQHATSVGDLNRDGLADPVELAQHLQFRVVDMNAIPADLRDFDFTWSSCSFEHLGSIAHGQEFVLQQLDCLKPGGVAVHTTEFNVSSNSHTADLDQTVLFRRRDIEWLVQRLRRYNHDITVDFDPGSTQADLHVDTPPYSSPHLKVRVHQYASTSIGLIIQKNPFAVDHPRWREGPWHVYRRARLERSNLLRRGRRPADEAIARAKRLADRCRKR